MEIAVDSKVVSQQKMSLGQFNDWWKQATGDILRNGKFLYMVIVDDMEFYADYESYIVQHFDKIHKVNLITKGELESAEETIAEICNYNLKLLQSCSLVSSGFYGEPDTDHWNLFSKFIEGVQWLSQSILFVETILEKHNHSLTNAQSMKPVIQMMQEKIAMLDEAVTTSDYTLMGDIVQYEFTELFQQIDQLFREEG
ncbi:hypothetical protein [Xylanibacillus composti]|nr:hypothetical protein [Xylanibacillus composti]